MVWVSPARPSEPAVRPDRPEPRPADLPSDPDDELSIDLLTDSFVVEGVAQIMADARRHGVGSPLLRPNSGAVFD
jgi:hypothetical protein